jgi:integrase
MPQGVPHNEMPIKLSDAYLRRLPPPNDDRRIADAQCPGLRLRLRPQRAPQWEHVYKVDGKAKYQSLGTYPDVGLADARALVEQRRRELRDKGAALDSPTAAARAARAEASQKAEKQLTVAKLFARWHRQDPAIERRDGGESIKSQFRNHVLPMLGEHDAEAVTRADVLKVLDAINAKGKKRTANLVLQHIRRMYEWGHLRELAAVNPASSIQRKHAGGAERSGKRYLRPSEIRLLAGALPESGLTEVQQHGVWLLLATLVRVGALYEARWSDFDMDYENRRPVWRAWNQKTRGEPTRYDIPLSRFALRHLRALRNLQMDLGIWSESQWVMRAEKGDGKPDQSLTHAIRDRQREGSQATGKKRTSNSSLVLPEGYWTPHDLRRTAASYLQFLSVREEVRRSLQDHKPEQKIAVVYDRGHVPPPERRRAIDKLGTELELLAAGKRSQIEREAEGDDDSPPPDLADADENDGAPSQQTLWRQISHSKALMTALVATKPMTAIAAECGKSETAVRKACTKLGVEPLPQGYWLRRGKPLVSETPKKKTGG